MKCATLLRDELPIRYPSLGSNRDLRNKDKPPRGSGFVWSYAVNAYTTAATIVPTICTTSQYVKIDIISLLSISGGLIQVQKILINMICRRTEKEDYPPTDLLLFEAFANNNCIHDSQNEMARDLPRFAEMVYQCNLTAPALSPQKSEPIFWQ